MEKGIGVMGVKKQFKNGGTFAEMWTKRHIARLHHLDLGHVTIQVVQGRLQVSAPYNDQFVAGAKQLSGKWKYRSRVWSFPVESQPLLLKLIEDCYHKKPVTIMGVPQ